MPQTYNYLKRWRARLNEEIINQKTKIDNQIKFSLYYGLSELAKHLDKLEHEKAVVETVIRQMEEFKENE